LEKIQFAPAIDVPLTLLVLAGFLLHSQSWARREDVDATVDLSARLPTARFRLISLFVAILGICWACNIAVWSLFAFLLGVGIVVALLFGGDVEGGGIFLFFAAYAIREWAFGFPHLVLEPPRQERMTTHGMPPSDDNPLIGKSGIVASPLRPCGEIECDGTVWPAKADDGQLIDAGIKVVVTGLQNGIFLVRIPNTE
jgi:membrane protein implicated in regulation of membrane protease activity